MPSDHLCEQLRVEFRATLAMARATTTGHFAQREIAQLNINITSCPERQPFLSIPSNSTQTSPYMRYDTFLILEPRNLKLSPRLRQSHQGAFRRPRPALAVPASFRAMAAHSALLVSSITPKVYSLCSETTLKSDNEKKPTIYIHEGSRIHLTKNSSKPH